MVSGKLRGMKVYACQTDIVWENKAANFSRVRQLLGRQHIDPGSLIILPEMFATGFSMEVEAIKEGAQGETEQFLRELAREFQSTVLGGLVGQAPSGAGLNQAVVIHPNGELAARYSKIHPFTLGGELKNYNRGAELQLFDWQGLKVAPFICYDLRFPEIFRSAVRLGAEMFVVIASWPGKRIHHWTTLLKARAIENLAYVVGVNRMGVDPQHNYPGRSLIVNPHGEVLFEIGPEEGIISSDINPAIVRDWRRDFPALNDMHWTK